VIRGSALWAARQSLYPLVPSVEHRLPFPPPLAVVAEAHRGWGKLPEARAFKFIGREMPDGSAFIAGALQFASWCHDTTIPVPIRRGQTKSQCHSAQVNLGTGCPRSVRRSRHQDEKGSVKRALRYARISRLAIDKWTRTASKCRGRSDPRVPLPRLGGPAVLVDHCAEDLPAPHRRQYTLARHEINGP
jgi:hypothetical protein